MKVDLCTALVKTRPRQDSEKFVSEVTFELTEMMTTIINQTMPTDTKKSSEIEPGSVK